MGRFVTDRRARPISVIVSAVLTVFTLGYFLPWTVAALRGKSNAWAIFWLNLLLGWTVLGWIAALVLACTAHQFAGIAQRRR